MLGGEIAAAPYLCARWCAWWFHHDHVPRAFRWIHCAEPAENACINEVIVVHHKKLGAAR